MEATGDLPLTVLLVDDDPRVLEAFRRGLEAVRPCWRVLTADSIEAARRLLRRHPVDALVADVCLPSGSGVMLCREVKRTLNLPVLLVSGVYTESFQAALGLNLGADDYLTKPVSPHMLAARIQAVCRRWPSGGQATLQPS